VHDPRKIVADLAAALALGGDCLADIAVLRDQPKLAGRRPRTLAAIRVAVVACFEQCYQAFQLLGRSVNSPASPDRDRSR
jgi:hypothetical protein